MSTIWFKHFVGFKQPDDVVALCPNSTVELTIHVTYKTIQAGTLLGSCLVGPIYQAIRGPRTADAFKARFFRGGAIGALVGLVAGPLMTYAVIRKDPVEKVDDRCYRLRFNMNQLNLDRISTVTTGVGAAMGGLPGLVLGVNLGLVLGNVYNNTVGKSK